MRFQPRAEDNLRDIWRAIVPDNQRAADTLLRRIAEKAELAAAHPHMGHPAPKSALPHVSSSAVTSSSMTRCPTGFSWWQ
ncbi:type II toxin-antitoxin system RelE/ParE family toxin [Rhizobium sp. ZX09]|uniref:type II toxin-antitoxin system RelE/ParE family toxin n=1 Tax=Rhizobium sp. ZX09 TaxID=2291939 RepID=UPI001FEDC081|nr:type II toxin-antitoxin system RelE/ParE family toxin [Rhizobium sp. ZX09]